MLFRSRPSFILKSHWWATQCLLHILSTLIVEESFMSQEARFFSGSFGSDSIGLIKVAEDGSMTHTCLSAQEDAAYLSFDRERCLLYALSESNDLRKSILNVYRWNGEQLSLLTSRQLGAIGACHITHSGNALLLSY